MISQCKSARLEEKREIVAKKLTGTMPDGSTVKVKPKHLQPKKNESDKRPYYSDGVAVNGRTYDAGWYSQPYWLWVLPLQDSTVSDERSSTLTTDYSSQSSSVDSSSSPSYVDSSPSYSSSSSDSGGGYSGGGDSGGGGGGGGGGGD